MPVFAIWLSIRLYPIAYYKDILGSVRDFADCTVYEYDPAIDAMAVSNQTIEIAQVDHQIKLI